MKNYLRSSLVKKNYTGLQKKTLPCTEDLAGDPVILMYFESLNTNFTSK